MVNLVKNRRTRTAPSGGPIRVAVIGGGAAGVLAALHLLRSSEWTEVSLIEPSPQLAAGAAFGTPHPAHLLNVPAARMSAFPDEPDDFATWLAGAGVSGTFVPRRLFGEYLRERLATAKAQAQGRLQVVHGSATNVAQAERATIVELADGRSVRADIVLVAIGPPRRLHPPLGSDALSAHRGFVADPLREHALDRIRRGDRALLVGTGLTMVDVALTLAARGVELTAVSRRGLVPLSHPTSAPAGVELALPAVLTALLRAVRHGAEQAEHWSAAIDALRADTQLLWSGLSFLEQQRFLRHAAPYWNAHRHRLPPETAAAFRQLLDEGAVEVLAGRIASARPLADGIEVEVVRRSSQETTSIHVTHLVNCTGPARLADEPPALVRSLVRSGLARLDAHGLGLDTSADGRLIGAAGRPEASLFAIGALRRGTLWESTAIPEIRAQAAAFAQLVARTTQASPPQRHAHRPHRA